MRLNGLQRNRIQLHNENPPAKPEDFHFRAVSPNATSGAQAALMTTWQSCDCYLLPVNGCPSRPYSFDASLYPALAG